LGLGQASLGQTWLWWFGYSKVGDGGFRFKPIFDTQLPKNDTQFKSG